MMKKIIELPNRDNLKTELVQVKDNIYKLEQEGMYPYRIIGSVSDIKAIDPSGGPFISVGFEVDGYIVDEIKGKTGLRFILKEKD